MHRLLYSHRSDINNTPKIIVSAHFPHKRLVLAQFTATLEELDTILGKFPKHEVLMGLDANAKLAGHSDGLQSGKRSPKLRKSDPSS